VADHGAMTTHVRNGMGAVRPYVYGPSQLLDFVQRTFGAEVVERSPDGSEVELRIDDSMIALSLGERFPENAGTRGSIQVYVEDVDATYGRALDAGATALSAPEDKPYRDRAAGVRDVFGNHWWISSYLGDA
jgi:PhnB protein